MRGFNEPVFADNFCGTFKNGHKFLQPSQQEVGSRSSHLLNLGWPCDSLWPRLQQKWCCATSKLRPQGAGSFSTCPLKIRLLCKQAPAGLLEITVPANSRHQPPDRWVRPCQTTASGWISDPRGDQQKKPPNWAQPNLLTERILSKDDSC